MDIREKLVELMGEHNSHYVVFCDDCFMDTPEEFNSRMYGLADHLIANGVMFQRYAHWKDMVNIGSFCFAYCSNCCTEHKAQNYAALATQHRFCRWCGARMTHQPPKGE